jgi:hypothetical protein
MKFSLSQIKVSLEFKVTAILLNIEKRFRIFALVSLTIIYSNPI